MLWYYAVCGAFLLKHTIVSIRVDGALYTGSNSFVKAYIMQNDEFVQLDVAPAPARKIMQILGCHHGL
jgi:hypothetical protein